MEQSLYSRLLLFTYILNKIITSLIIVKIKNFKQIKYFLENLDASYNNIDQLYRINRYHSFIISALRITNCFIKSVSLFVCLKVNGFTPILHIDFKKDEVFYSHAWVSVGSKRFFYESEVKMKNILKIS